MTWKFWINSKGYYNFKSFKVYWAYRQLMREELYELDNALSFSGQFLKEGFKTYGIGFRNNKNPNFEFAEKQIRSNENWFGTSLYEPDTIFLKDDKELVMSLQGISTPYNSKYKELFDSCSIKYIRLKHKDKVIYENWTGNLPDKETVKQFLNYE